jgi:hypothetical protein
VPNPRPRVSLVKLRAGVLRPQPREDFSIYLTRMPHPRPAKPWSNIETGVPRPRSAKALVYPRSEGCRVHGHGETWCNLLTGGAESSALVSLIQTFLTGLAKSMAPGEPGRIFLFLKR